jgi:hypothetical protein
MFFKSNNRSLRNYLFRLGQVKVEAKASTLAGFDLTAHCSSLLGGRRRRCMYVDHAARATKLKVRHEFDKLRAILNFTPGPHG